MKVLITGAHFTPAQAVIEELQEFPGVEITYIGRRYTLEGDKVLSFESQILPKMGVKFIPIIAGRLRRNFDVYTLTSLLKIPVGFIQAFYELVKEKPDVALSFGGYVGLPVVVSAWLLSIPVIIHEQTLVSGLSNKISRLFASKIAVSFEKNYPKGKQKFVLTGNPIRDQLINAKDDVSDEIKKFINQSKLKKLPVIYITGGNQGSHVINQAVLSILEDLTKKYFIIHQTGDSKFSDYKKLVDKKKQLKYTEKYLVRRWFDAAELARILPSTQLAISRAGINSLLEFLYFGIPAVSIPLPYLYQDEQKVNSIYFKNIGLCQTLSQDALNGKKILSIINNTFKNYSYFKKNATEAKENFILDAAKKITQELLLLLKGAKC